MNEEQKKTIEPEEMKEAHTIPEESIMTPHEYLEGWQRCQADFQNYKRDESKRAEDIIRYANQDLMTDLIEAIDIFDLAGNFIPAEIKDNHKQWLDGFFFGVRQLESQLKKHGLERIEASGVAFNPELHEAIEGESVEASPSQSMVEQVRAGYTLNGKLIRPARVKIKNS